MTPITPTTPTPGSVPGFQATCGCGLHMTNTFQQSLELDIQAHVAWHIRQGHTSERTGR